MNDNCIFDGNVEIFVGITDGIIGLPIGISDMGKVIIQRMS